MSGGPIFQKKYCAHDRKDSKTMYSLLRKAFGPHSSSVVPLRSKDGTSLLKDPVGITQR